MSALRRALARSGDLALAVGIGAVLVVLMAVGPIHPLVDGARLVLGLAFVLFVPGYCLLAVLAPRPGAFDRAERVGISVGASVAVIPVLALLLDWLPWGLRPWPIVLGEAIFTVVLAVVAVWQRARVGEDRPVTPTRGPAPRAGIRSWMAQLTPVERVAYPLVLVVALAASAIGLNTVIMPSPRDLMTELYVLGRTGLAEQFPRVVETGEPVSVTLGLVNRELFQRTYRVETWTHDAWSAEQGTQLVPPTTVSVAPHERIEWPLTWRMPQPGDDQAVDVLVYVEDEAEPYRRVRLWLDVLPPSTASGAQAARPDVEATSQGIEADLTAPPAGGAQATPPPPSEHLPVSVPEPVAAGVVPTLAVPASAQQSRERGRIAAATPVPTSAATSPATGDLVAGAGRQGGGDGATPVPTPVPAADASSPPAPAAIPSAARATGASEPASVQSVAPSPTPVPAVASGGGSGTSGVPLPTPGAAASFQHADGPGGPASATVSRVLAGFVPWWVKNHRNSELDTHPPGQVGGVTVPTSGQFCSFLVVEPQTSDELRVLNPYSGQEVWIPSGDVGPVAAPRLGRGEPPSGLTCSEAIFPTTRTVLAGTADAGWRWTARSAPAAPGDLALRVAPGGGLALAIAPVPSAIDDLIVTATLRLSGETTDSRYGVFVRAGGAGASDGTNAAAAMPTGRFYGFWIDSAGRAGIMRREATGWVDRTAPTQAGDGPFAGRTVEMRVAALGNLLLLLIDGEYVASVVDSAPMAGGVGLFADGVDGGMTVERVVVEDVEEGCWATGGDVARQLAC